MSSLTFDPDDVVAPSGHFIGGALRDAGGDTIEVLRPSDGERLGAITDAGESVVDEAVSDALRAWKTSNWAKAPPRDRARVMRRWADLIDADTPRLAQLEAVGSTRPVTEAAGDDIPFASDAIRFFAELADKLGGDVAATRRDSLGMVISEPYGVIGAITPWNFPLYMSSWKCGAALAAGNAIVLKPSELTPFSALRMAQLAVDAGVPAGLFNIVGGYGHSTGSALVRHPDIGKVSFTGSTSTGKAIMTDAARGLKPVTLELGGKSPQLVFGKVPNLEHVARCIVRGFTSNGGQVCVAGSRLIAHRSIVEALIAAILRLIEKIKPGPTWDERTTYGPIISHRQASRIHSIVQQSLTDGVELLTGGGMFEETAKGCFYRPTVLTGVSEAMPVVREEVFGPVLTVQTFDDEAEGIAMAAHPQFGLAAGVHSSDLGQAMRAMRGLAAGTIWINRYGRSRDMIIPSGGFQQSGIGKDLGVQAVEACQRYKSVLMDFDV